MNQSYVSFIQTQHSKNFHKLSVDSSDVSSLMSPKDMKCKLIVHSMESHSPWNQADVEWWPTADSAMCMID